MHEHEVVKIIQLKEHTEVVGGSLQVCEKKKLKNSNKTVIDCKAGERKASRSHGVKNAIKIHSLASEVCFSFSSVYLWKISVSLSIEIDRSN